MSSSHQPLARITNHLWKKKNPFPLPLPESSNQEHPNIHSILDSLKSLSALGHLSQAFTTFSLLHLHSPSPLLLLQPLSSLLHLSASQRAFPQGIQLHAHVLCLGFHDHPSLVAKLTSFYSSLGLLSGAHSIVSNSTNLYALPWNFLISAYVRDGLSSNAIIAYKEMVGRGVVPDCFTYPSVLRACSETLDLELGREVHRYIESCGMEWNLFAHNALVGMYVKCGELCVARKLFDEMLERDVVSWNSIISGYASKGMWKEAFELFERMREDGLDVNSVTWNTIVGGYMQMGDHEKALGLISQMIGRGADVDFVTLVIGLNACSRIGSVRLGKEFHGLAVRILCDGIETVRNALITMYSRCKDMERAYLLFQMAGNRSLITWNAMMAGFALSDQAEEASQLFRDLVESGLQPNYVTIVTYLALCARVANLQHGQELHCYITKYKFKGYRLLWNSLIDLYSKSGRILIARRVFNMMDDRDEVSYTSMIAGYGMQGDGISALKLFDQMIDFGIKPDHISMVAVLSACAHSGLVSEGEILHDKMVNLYRIRPQMEHYSCMVDLFARAGLLKKAEEILERTPFPPTAAMWAALVGACQVHGNTEIGERAARKLLDMRTENAGHYVLIANMYATAGCWEDLATVRTRMRDLGVRKAPGLAWADLGNGFHPFAVGDTSNPLAPEIYEVLEELSSQMRDAGNVKNLDLACVEGLLE
ncbi:pentatricopeptide repeat-containing protein At1g71490-like [Typha angustifolia]|uniref:pentatricopeptide repeat-containing protein At1g71490-like n=1 Tax=Typha angustifolia TaxID=59011 RepID=UPI003C2B229A